MRVFGVAPAASFGVRKILDTAERIIIVALYAFLLHRFAGSLSEQPLNAVFLVIEGIVMLMVIVRRSTDQISLAPRDWLFAFGGTFVLMLLIPGEPIPGLSPVAPIFLFLGMAISLSAKLQLRRSFGIVAANRGLKTTGLYGTVRHPMYLGYFVLYIGMIMLNFSSWNVLLLIVWTSLQIVRIHAEETILSRDADYLAHMRKVQYRLVPFVY